jgi:hypothetical protein
MGASTTCPSKSALDTDEISFRVDSRPAGEQRRDRKLMHYSSTIGIAAKLA